MKKLINVNTTSNAATASTMMNSQNSLAFNQNLSLGMTPMEVFKKISKLCIKGEIDDEMEWIEQPYYKEKLQSVRLTQDEINALENVDKLIISDMPEDLQKLMAGPQGILVFEVAIAVAAVALAIAVVIV